LHKRLIARALTYNRYDNRLHKTAGYRPNQLQIVYAYPPRFRWHWAQRLHIVIIWRDI